MAVEGSFTWGQSTATVRVGQTITVPVDADIANADGISFGSKAEITSVTFSQVTIRGLEEGSVTIPADEYWSVPRGGPGGATVDMSTTNSFTLTVLPDEPKIATQGQWNDLASKVKAKQDALTAGSGIDITSNVVSTASLQLDTGTVTPVSVGTSFVDLKSFNIQNTGTYMIWSEATRSGNSSSGCLLYMKVVKGTTDIVSAYNATVANYVGNHEPNISIAVAFTATAGDTVKIQIRKDRTDYASNLGCAYSLVQVGY